MKGFLLLCCCTLLVANAIAYTPVALSGTVNWFQIDKNTFKFNYTENGWATTLVGWIEFPDDPTTITEKVVPIFIGHGNAYDVDLYLNQYCSPYFYSRGYMCFGPTLTHVILCPNLGEGLSLSDCSDSPENLKRSVRTIDILFSSAFMDKFGDLIEYDSLVGFGHSYGSYLMTALTPIEPRFTSAVIMSGGKKSYGTQYTDEYYANTSMPLLRLHGVNDSLVPVAQEADETTILRKGGVENFLLVLNNQGHVWTISTVGGVMDNWFRTYDPRNNSAVIPVIESTTQQGNTIYLRGRGFGTNQNGFSMVFDDSSLPYTQVPGAIVSWSDTEVAFTSDTTMSSSHIVANADSADYATSQVVDHFGGVFSRKMGTNPSSGSNTPSSGNTPSGQSKTPVKTSYSSTTYANVYLVSIVLLLVMHA